MCLWIVCSLFCFSLLPNNMARPFKWRFKLWLHNFPTYVYVMPNLTINLKFIFKYVAFHAY
jgi:hypothetical protein